MTPETQELISKLEAAVQALEIGKGSEHFRHGRETMRDDVLMLIAELKTPEADLSLEQLLDAFYCPHCNHPWSYHDGGCHMPVTPGTNLPVTRNDPVSKRCDCTAIAPITGEEPSNDRHQ